MTARLRIAADIGGTFTDIAVILDGGAVATRKVPSTPADYALGVLQGIRELAGAHDLALGDIGEVLHGCTIATNAILEGKGARTALITTAGFRDVLELRRIRIPRLYDPLYVKPEPLAPRDLRLEVTERLDANGNVLIPLVEADVMRCVEILRRAAVEAVAVCLLHSYANPAHEQQVGAILRRSLPGVFVTLSAELLPEIREYERTSTAVINSYVGPVVARYIGALADALKAAGIDGRLLVMQSSGGILEAGRVIETPARIVECGPAAGVIGAACQARLAGLRNVITLDMGGTTAKASLIEDGAISRTDEYEVGGGISLSSRLVKGGGYALKLPVIDISEVGAGGGSIVWFDKAGGLKVGPHSAGASPGPACYGTGGSEATVTDANLVLGFINPQALAGGTMAIHAELSRAVIAGKVMPRVGLDLLQSAWAVHVVATANMMRAVKAVSTYRGRDPADFVLMAFGGNGGIFAAELARQLQMSHILIPPGAGVFSAIGLIMADKAFGRSRAFMGRVDRIDTGALNQALRELQDGVIETLGAAAGEHVDIRRSASMRYAGQAFELPVRLPSHDLGPADLPALADAFEAEHERSYGHRLTDAVGVDTVALEVVAATSPWNGVAPMPLPPDGTAPAATERLAYFGPELGARRTTVIPRRSMLTQRMNGPLIVEEYEGTTVVPPGAVAWLDEHANIAIAFAE